MILSPHSRCSCGVNHDDTPPVPMVFSVILAAWLALRGKAVHKCLEGSAYD